MTAARVHAVMAAALARPGLISRWRDDPQSLRRHGVDPETFDLDALRNFAGLALKIRHNPLHADFPLTFRFLKVAGLEIELFAAYAAHRETTRAPLPAAPSAKADALVAFLESQPSVRTPASAILLDIVRHEHALMQLIQAVVADTPADGMAAPDAASVPRRRGSLILHEMHCDPRAVGLALYEKTPELIALPQGTFYFAYWREGAACEVQMIELDALAHGLLSLVNGEAPAASLCRQLGLNKRQLCNILSALGELATLGVVTFDRKAT